MPVYWEGVKKHLKVTDKSVKGGGVEGDIWWPNTLGLSFSNRFSHVEMRKCKNFEKKMILGVPHRL